MSKWRQRTPLEWEEYVNKQVRVTAHEQQQHRGWLQTVDPVSASVVLVTFPDAGGCSVDVVMGHAVEQVEVVGEADEETLARLSSVFLPREGRRRTPKQLQRRQEQLRAWLEANRVPVERDGDTLRVANNVLTVRAPYGAEDCSSANEIILSRVQALVERLPLAEEGHEEL